MKWMLEIRITTQASNFAKSVPHLKEQDCEEVLGWLDTSKPAGGLDQ